MQAERNPLRLNPEHGLSIKIYDRVTQKGECLILDAVDRCPNRPDDHELLEFHNMPSPFVGSQGGRSACVSAHCATGFAIPVTFFDRCALIVALFTACERQLDLGAPPPEINGQRHEGEALLADAMIHPLDLLPIQK